MAKQNINVGTTANDKKGDSLRAAFQKVNANFTELYAALGLTDVTLNLGAFTFTGSTMSTDDSTAIVIDKPITVNGEIVVDGDITPSVANGSNLGSPTKPFRSLYVSNNTIFLGGVSLSLDASNNLTVNGSRVGATSYADLTNTPTGFSSLVNDTKTVSLASNGVLTLANTARLQDNSNGAISLGITASGFATAQGAGAIAIGQNAGGEYQSADTVAVGYYAGSARQGASAVAVGRQAGQIDQGVQAVAFGTRAGGTTQGNNATAIGADAGYSGQGSNATAVGGGSAQTSQGAAAVAVGYLAGQTNQAANTIILNATGSAVNGVAGQTNSFYAAPIRNASGTSGLLQYDATTKEVSYSSDIRSEGNINIEINLSDSTKRIWQFGEDGLLTFPDDTVQTTAYTGPQTTLVGATVAAVGGTASANETGITYSNKIAIFTEGAFTVGVWTDVQVGWTVTDNNGFTDTIASRGGFGAASFVTTVNNWPAPASGKTYVFTSPDYQPASVSPVEITVGNNDWTFDNNGGLTLPTGVTNNGRIINDNGISLKVDSSYWTFGTDGSLTIPGDIQSENDVNIRINNNDSSTYTWNFGDTGDLTLPIGGSIVSNSSITVTSELGGTSSGVFVDGTDGSGNAILFATNNAIIRSDNDGTSKDWTFSVDGNLQAPGTVSAPNINATNHFMLPVYATEAARDSAITSPQPGMMVYVSSGEGAGLQVRGATQWNPVGGLTGV